MTSIPTVFKMAGRYLAELISWPKHSFSTSYGPLSQLIFQYILPLRKVVDQASVTQATMTGILFVLRTGVSWEYLPRELGAVAK